MSDYHKLASVGTAYSVRALLMSLCDRACVPSMILHTLRSAPAPTALKLASSSFCVSDRELRRRRRRSAT